MKINTNFCDLYSRRQGAFSIKSEILKGFDLRHSSYFGHNICMITVKNGTMKPFELIQEDEFDS